MSRDARTNIDNHSFSPSSMLLFRLCPTSDRSGSLNPLSHSVSPTSYATEPRERLSLSPSLSPQSPCLPSHSSWGGLSFPNRPFDDPNESRCSSPDMTSLSHPTPNKAATCPQPHPDATWTPSIMTTPFLLPSLRSFTQYSDPSISRIPNPMTTWLAFLLQAR